MKRLGFYLLRLFATDTLALFAIMLALIWMSQWLRLFDVVSVKGQSMLSLFGQAGLTLPALSIVFLYVVVGIGLGRALLRLQANQELHIIHAGRQVPALVRAVTAFAVIAALVVLAISNVLAPAANHSLDEWSARIAADLVSRSLTPHRFTEVVPGVVIAIGGRAEDGRIENFFADDRRDPEDQRTYVADSARVGRDAEGYVIELENGVLQYDAGGREFSQISFSRYNLAVGGLTETSGGTGGLDARSSIELAGQALATGKWDPAVVRKLVERGNEALRVIAMCVFVLGLLGLPHARRGRGGMPIELTVLLVAFAERGLTTYSPLPYLVGPLTGALALLGIGLCICIWRFRLLAPMRFRRVTA